MIKKLDTNPIRSYYNFNKFSFRIRLTENMKQIFKNGIVIINVAGIGLSLLLLLLVVKAKRPSLIMTR